MDCDQVFSVLTRGPFPTGDSSDVAVELHLERCDECWRIAEALRPAHDLFEESIPADETRDLPGYWGDTAASRTAYAQVQASAIRTATAPRIGRPSRATGFAPRGVPETIGWFDVMRITSFLLLLSCAAFGMAWLWQ
jgi:hypothetical protein